MVYSGCCAVTCIIAVLVVLAFAGAIIGQKEVYSFGRQRDKCGQEGVVHKIGTFCGGILPRVVVKRRYKYSFAPSFVAAPLAQTQYPKKKKGGARAWHGLRLSCHRVRMEIQAVWDKR